MNKLKVNVRLFGDLVESCHFSEHIIFDCRQTARVVPLLYVEILRF